MQSLDHAIERHYDLNVGFTQIGKSSRHERPHKPLLLLAAFDLIDEGLAMPDRIPWCQELRDRFSARFEVVRKHNDQNSPENPFLYLRNEGFWEPSRGTQALASTPLVNDFGQVLGSFVDGFDILVSIPDNRSVMREALIADQPHREPATQRREPRRAAIREPRAPHRQAHRGGSGVVAFRSAGERPYPGR